MFKCKQCGHKFGANTPEHCPGCGAANEQQQRSARGLMLLFAIETIGSLGVLILLGLIAAGVVALAMKYL